MRRSCLIGVLMMILTLTGCGGGQGSEAEALALAVRGTYLAMEGCTARVQLEADYGQRVYSYGMDVRIQGEELALTLTEPELVAGLTARAVGTEGTLEFDGVSVETGPLDEEGLTPFSALPALFHAARSGYMTACALEEDGERRLLRIECGQPEQEKNEGRTITLWFEADSHALVAGEIAWEGARTISCRLEGFEIQMSGPDEAGPEEDT